MGEEETEEAPSPPPPLATLCSGGILSEPDLDSIPKIAHGREREKRELEVQRWKCSEKASFFKFGMEPFGSTL